MTLENIKSGTVMAQSGTVSLGRLGKTHQDYWQSRLKKRSYEGPRGKTFVVPGWQVRISLLGRREWFNTGTPNKAAAGARARDIYLSLLASGWDATLARFKPDQIVDRDCSTVGRFLDTVKANSGLRHITFEIYARKFRTLVAGVFGVKAGKEKFDYVHGGRQKFVDRVHRIRLDRLTAERVERWKIRYLKTAERKDPLAYKRARTTINSVIRGSKSLFAPAVLARVKVTLPSPLPLANVANVPVERARYRSSMDPAALLVAAKKELSTAKPESFKILLLALGAGLRRDEIDTLTWKQINSQRNVIRVETTTHTAAKSNASEGEVDVDPELLKVFKGYMGPGSGEFVIASPNKPRPQSLGSYHYRAEQHFAFLIRWLRSKGVASPNPLHTLRKEFGSQIAAQGGIFAASLALRHADIQLTRDYYLDKKQATVFAIGNLLNGGGS